MKDFDKNRYFSKFWPNFEKFDFNQDFSNSLTKLRFSKILTKTEISKDFDPNRYFSKILTQIRIFWKFDINWDFSKIWPKSRWFENFDQIWDFQKFWSKSKYFENLNQNRDFQRLCPKSLFVLILSKIEIFRKFLLHSRFFKNFVQNRTFWQFDKNRGISKIFSIMDSNRFHRFWPKSLFFSNFDWNTDFSKVPHQLRFLKNLTQIEIFRSKSRYFGNLN